jgi:dienelactone hydrolase
MILTLTTILTLVAPDPPPLEDHARAFVAALARGDYAAAGQDFDEAMRKAMPADKLERFWKSLAAQGGPFQKVLTARAEAVDPYTRVHVVCQFEKVRFDVRVVYDRDRKVTGLNVLPVEDPADFPPPPYADRAKFRESEVTVSPGEWALPGTLTVPAGDGPFPAAVLVHGSGPHDRDETIGKAKVFRDLAWGLASRGVAVLRYEKRTQAHGAKFAAQKSYTLREEVTDDAAAAAELLRRTPGIDPKRVVVVGHSLGAMAAPRIARQDGKLAGIVVMAAPTRPITDVMLEQVAYVPTVKEKLSDADKAFLDKIKSTAERLKKGDVKPDTPASELAFAPGSYWLDFAACKPAAEAAALDLPILVMQGGRDYQTTMADFRGWESALAGLPKATLKSYPKLNHAFVPGEGTSRPQEYEQPGHVDPAVVEDLAAWIKRR